MDLIKRVETILAYLPSSLSNDYSVLQRENIYLFPPENNWINALKKIADPFYNFRNKTRSNYLKTPNFGFPILHRTHNMTVKARKSNNHKEHLERRASPLIFKLIKTGNNLYFPIIIRLNGKLIPDDYEIYAQPHDKNQVPNETCMPNSTIIEEFQNLILQNKEVIKI